MPHKKERKLRNRKMKLCNPIYVSIITCKHLKSQTAKSISSILIMCM